MKNFFLHLLPGNVKKDSLSFAKTQWTGIAACVSFLLLCLTGGLLMFFYVPSAQGAYDSIIFIDSIVPLGRFTRSLHRFSTQFFVIALAAHTLKALFSSSFLHNPKNWFIGLGIFAVSMVLAYTGYLLPYDQLSYWAVTVGLNLLRSIPLLGPPAADLLFGSAVIDGATITRFYGYHAALGPALIVLLLVFHFWEIRQTGVYTSLRCKKLLNKEEAAKTIGLISGAALLLCVIGALLVAPALGARPWSEPPNPAKAPWYFLGIQELVSHSNGLLAVPLLLAAIFLAAPFALKKKGVKTPVFIAAGILLAVIAGATVIGGLRGEDWKLAGSSAGTPALLSAIASGKDYTGKTPSGIVEMKAFGRLERCLSCHGDMKHDAAWIDETHPAQAYGCSSCHGGTALSLDPEIAHRSGKGYGRERLLAGYISYASCFKCHIPGRLKGTELAARGAELLTKLGCPSCHKVGGIGRNKSLSSVLYRDLDYLRDVLLNPARHFADNTMPGYAIFEEDERFREIAVALIGTSLEKIKKPSVDWAINCSICHPLGAGARPKRFHGCPSIRRHSKIFSCMRCHDKRLKPRGKPCPYIEDHAVSCGICHG